MARIRSRNNDEKLERREAILDSAMAAFFAKGLEKTSMDEIAKGARLSRPLLYVYFKDKDDIHMGLCVRALQTLARYMIEERSHYDRGIDQVHATGEAYYRFYREEADLFNVLTLRLGKLNEVDIDPDDVTPLMMEMQTIEDGIMSGMAEAIQTGIKDKTIDKSKIQDPLQTAMFLRGSVHGVIMLQDAAGSKLFDRTGLERKALIDYGIRSLTNSLAL